MQDGQILVRWDDIRKVGLNLHPVFDSNHFHLCIFFQKIRHEADMGGVQVRHQDKGHAAIHRHMGEELFKGLQAPCGCTDADHRKACFIFLRREHSFLVLFAFGRGLFSCFSVFLRLGIFFPGRHDHRLSIAFC